MTPAKDLAYYMALRYTIEIFPSEEGGYAARIRELPGCLTQADTWAEIDAMIQDAKQAWLETALERGMTIPEPQPVAQP